ncbi:MAG: rhodanese-like domain-containing protein [Proteobacteria bacterium]|nr:rhodanese-like domain-containing protein [Pseudomonadota bacterium]
MSGFTEVPPETVNKWLGDGDAVVIDVREAEELAQTRLAGAIHLPMSAFDPDKVPTDTGKKVVFICALGQRSEQIGMHVVAEGILGEAYNMAGGLEAWAEAGLPLETGPAAT